MSSSSLYINTYFTDQHAIGAEIGAEQVENLLAGSRERAFGAVERERSSEREVAERERSGEQGLQNYAGALSGYFAAHVLLF